MILSKKLIENEFLSADEVEWLEPFSMGKISHKSVAELDIFFKFTLALPRHKWAAVLDRYVISHYRDEPVVKAMSANDAAKRMKQLEKEMYECARNLEFERAAQLRDELEQIRASVFKQGVEAPLEAPSKKQGKTIA